jgi:hypothetical protein
MCDKLCNKQTEAMGTVHQNRNGVLVEIKKTELRKGENVMVYKDKVMIMK